MTNHAKATIDLLLATKAVVERDLILGLVTEEELRYRIAPDDRKRIAHDLKVNNGLSNRQIAKVLDVDEITVRRDLGAANVAPDATNVAGSMDVHYSSETDEWSTPQDLFDELNLEFEFDLDVCALDSSAKCERYFTPEIDGLSQDWSGSVWMNPPYGDVIGQWVDKARKSAVNGTTVVCLVPARVDTHWWWDNCRFGEIRFLRGRLKFGGSLNSAPFPSAVVVFGDPVEFPPSVIWWER